MIHRLERGILRWCMLRQRPGLHFVQFKMIRSGAVCWRLPEKNISIFSFIMGEDKYIKIMPTLFVV